MAKIYQKVIVDDITGETLEESDAKAVTLVLDGVEYRADLGPDSHSEFMATLEPYLDVFTRVGKVSKRKATRVTPGVGSSGLDNAAVRAWAAENGYKVSPRGRIPRNVIEAYKEAN